MPTCPVCKKEFKNTQGLGGHLKGTKCGKEEKVKRTKVDEKEVGEVVRAAIESLFEVPALVERGKIAFKPSPYTSIVLEQINKMTGKTGDDLMNFILEEYGRSVGIDVMIVHSKKATHHLTTSQPKKSFTPEDLAAIQLAFALAPKKKGLEEISFKDILLMKMMMR